MEAPRTVEDVFDNFSARRDGLIKALTTDVEDFYAQCDPDKENLCLYGNPDGTWEVQLPAEEVPPELPEPALGINFARDGMQRKDWLALVAVHSDAWLMAVAFYYGAKFDGKEREKLFKHINSLPTVYEILSGKAVNKPKAKAKGAAAGQVSAIPTTAFLPNFPHCHALRSFFGGGAGDARCATSTRMRPSPGSRGGLDVNQSGVGSDSVALTAGKFRSLVTRPPTPASRPPVCQRR